MFTLFGIVCLFLVFTGLYSVMHSGRYAIYQHEILAHDWLRANTRGIIPFIPHGEDISQSEAEIATVYIAYTMLNIVTVDWSPRESNRFD